VEDSNRTCCSRQGTWACVAARRITVGIARAANIIIWLCTNASINSEQPSFDPYRRHGGLYWLFRGARRGNFGVERRNVD
jgi:hypothetical protein